MRYFHAKAFVVAFLCAGPTLTAIAGDSIAIDQIPELTPVALCAFEAGSTLQPVVDVHGPTLSQQVAHAIVTKCPLDELRVAAAQLNLTTERDEYMRSWIGFAIRKSAWRGYFEANPLTEQTLREGSFDDGNDILTFVRPPGFTNGEIVEVSTSTFGKEREIGHRSTMRGAMDGFGYSRGLDSRGSIAWRRQTYGEHFEIECLTYISLGDLCTIRAAALAGRNGPIAFTAVFDGKTGRSMRLCASFFFGEREASTLEATMSIDDKVIPLDLQSRCVEDPTGVLIDAIGTARLVTSRIRYDDETRAHVYQTTTSGFVVARKLLSRLLEAGHPGIKRSSLEQPFEYAERRAPKTEDEMVSARRDWRTAADCVAEATTPETECARVLDRARTLWPESGLEWVTIGHERVAFLDPPQAEFDRLDEDHKLETGWSNPAFAKRIADLKVEAVRRRANVRPPDPHAVSFGENERDAVLDGRAAHAGFARTAAYAYRASAGSAVAVVARLFLPRSKMKSVVVTCERSAAPACAIHLPFEQSAGELVIRTDGDPWNSRLCLGAGAVPQGPLAITGERTMLGWRSLTRRIAPAGSTPAR